MQGRSFCLNYVVVPSIRFRIELTTNPASIVQLLIEEGLND
jgi:hypothetical protein